MVREIRPWALDVARVTSVDSTPAGVPAISRGLSEATPPVKKIATLHPGGVPAGLEVVDASHRINWSLSRIQIDAESSADGAATPAGVESKCAICHPGVSLRQPPANGCDPYRGRRPPLRDKNTLSRKKTEQRRKHVPAIKRKFGDSVRSKTDTAMKNEVLCKILCHSLTCLIQEHQVLGIVLIFRKHEPQSIDDPAILRLLTEWFKRVGD